MRTGLLCCGVILVGTAAHAMSIRTDMRTVARSDDGKVELVDQTEQGPEGGSRRTLVLGGERFLYSDTLSRGAGARTEYVSKEDCEKALRALQARLAQGFGKSKVTAHAEACAAERRAGAVGQP